MSLALQPAKPWVQARKASQKKTMLRKAKWTMRNIWAK
jgi:hypothetical protein